MAAPVVNHVTRLSITVPSPLGGCMWALSPSKQHGDGNVLVCQSNGYPQDSNPNIDKIIFVLKKCQLIL